MAEIKLFVTHTPNKVNFMVSDDFVVNVIAGADFQTNPLPENIYCDNEGQNISSRNKSYCELTTQYWAWKNIDTDYYGFCHYRRLFSFREQELSDIRYGVVHFPCLSTSTLNQIAFNQASVSKLVEGSDFLISEGIDIRDLGASSVADHYAQATELQYRDFDLMMNIIEELYPEMADCAKSFAQGTTFYPCNMFIANKVLFNEYSNFLFSVLDEFESRSDFKHYSIEAVRTTGHIGERLLGVFYTYLKSKNEYKLGEIQVVQFGKTPAIPTIHPSSETAIPIVLSSSDYYVPYLGICLSSIAKYASEEKNYDIVVLTTSISAENRARLQESLSCFSNIRLDFIDVDPLLGGYDLPSKDHIGAETFYRFLIPEIMKEYHKVVYLDSDLVVQADVAELHELSLGENLIAGVVDADFLAFYGVRDEASNKRYSREKTCKRLLYAEEVLNLDDPYGYVQAGVLLFNIAAMRSQFNVQDMLSLAADPKYIYMDQDILNMLCDGRILHLDPTWNVMMNHHFGIGRDAIIRKYAPTEVAEKYFASKKNPKIIHYAGGEKPWEYPNCEFASEFWEVARSTVFYEEIVYRGVMGRSERVQFENIQDRKVKNRVWEGLYRVSLRFLPDGSYKRKRAKEILGIN